MSIEVVQGEWQYFPYEQIELRKNNFLVSPCGTGKTTALKAWIDSTVNEDLKIIVVTFRISLAYMLAGTYGFENYLELKHEKSLSLEEHPRVVVSVESLQKFFYVCNANRELQLPDVLILDEYCSVIEHSFNTKTLDPSRRALFFTFLFAMLSNENKTVIGADAFFSITLDSDVFLELNRLYPAHLLTKYKVINNTYRKATRLIRIWQTPKHWKNLLLSTAKEGEKKVFLFVNNKTVSDAVMSEMATLKGIVEMDSSYPQSRPTECLYLSSDSSPNDVMRSSVNPNDEWGSYQIVSITPTIQAGISFDKEDYFDVGFGYAGLGSTQPLGILQQLARVRHYAEDMIELCVQKQTKAKTTTVPTIEETKQILEQKVQTFNNRYSKCCEVNYIYDPTQNVIRFGLDPKSIVNTFCVRVMRSEYFARQNYLQALCELAELDSYTVQILTTSEMKSITTKHVKQTREKDLTSRGYMGDTLEQRLDELEANANDRHSRHKEPFETSFPCTLAKHKTYKREVLFANWDGCFSSDTKITHATFYTKTKQFIEDWNILGALGSLRYLITIDETFEMSFEFADEPDVTHTLKVDYPQECAKLINFNPSTVGDFYTDFIADGKQDNFHEYITGDYRKMLRSGVQERDIGNTKSVSDAACFEFAVKLWDILEICPATIRQEKNWLGAMIVEHPQTILSSSTTRHNPDISLKEQSYYHEPFQYSHALSFKAECQKAFAAVDENLLASEEIAGRVKSLFLEYWDDIYTQFINHAYAPATRNIPEYFRTEIARWNRSNCSNFLRIVVDAIRETLNYIGLKIDTQSKTTIRTASMWHLIGHRVRLSKYKLLKFDERLMISYCRYVNQKGLRLSSMTHYPCADPFRLLMFNPVGSNVSASGFTELIRFKRFTWAVHPTAYEDLYGWKGDREQLQKYTRSEEIRRSRAEGCINSDAMMNTIFPNIANVRYYWYLFRLGQLDELSLKTKFVAWTLLVNDVNIIPWLKNHRYSDEEVDVATEVFSPTYQESTAFKLTGLYPFKILCTDDLSLKKIIEEHNKRKVKWYLFRGLEIVSQ